MKRFAYQSHYFPGVGWSHQALSTFAQTDNPVLVWILVKIQRYCALRCSLVPTFIAVSFSSASPLWAMSTPAPASQNASQASASSAHDETNPDITELPGYFEDVALDDLVVLIGECNVPAKPSEAEEYIFQLFWHCDIADLLQRMILHNDQIPLSAWVDCLISSPEHFKQSMFWFFMSGHFREGLTRFHSRSTPGISVLDYLRRIVRYVRVEVNT